MQDLPALIGAGETRGRLTLGLAEGLRRFKQKTRHNHKHPYEIDSVFHTATTLISNHILFENVGYHFHNHNRNLNHTLLKSALEMFDYA